MSSVSINVILLCDCVYSTSTQFCVINVFERVNSFRRRLIKALEVQVINAHIAFSFLLIHALLALRFFAIKNVYLTLLSSPAVLVYCTAALHTCSLHHTEQK